MSDGVALEVSALTKRYAQTLAVDHLSFSVGAGSIYGLLGPNGAGKTTTLECVEGLRAPDGGSVSVLGIDPTIVLSSHDMAEAEKLCDRIGIIIAGRLSIEGTPRQITAAGDRRTKIRVASARGTTVARRAIHGDNDRREWRQPMTGYVHHLTVDLKSRSRCCLGDDAGQVVPLEHRVPFASYRCSCV